MLTIAGTSLRRFIRDRSNLWFVFGFPILIILFIGLQFGSGSVSTLGVVGADTPVGELVVEAATEAGFGIERFADRAEAEEWVERGWVRAAVVVPDGDPFETSVEVSFLAREGFGSELVAPVQAAISTANLAPTATEAVVAATGADPAEARRDVTAAAAAQAPTAVDTRVVGDPLFEGDVGVFDLGASSQLVLFTFLTSLASSGYLILTRKLGVARRMLASPTHPTEIVIGETAGRYGIALVQALFIVVVTAVAFGVDWGDPLGSAAIIAVFALVSTASGILLGSLLQSDQTAGGVGVMIGIGLGALGGCMVPYEIFPETIQQVSRFTPHNWALQGFRTLLFEDGTIADIGLQLAVLGGMAGVLMAVAIWAYRRSIVSV